VNAHLSDDFMNLVEVAAAAPSTGSEDLHLFGLLLMNRHCYLATPFADPSDDSQQLRRSVELKQDILSSLFGWQLLVLDEADYLAQPTYEERKRYVIERMGIKGQGAE